MSAPVHRFGDFRIDPAARELWQGEKLVALPPKSFECLAYLIENRERAVGRDELISAVWGRADVSDDLLAQTLLRARRAVGDTGNEQRAIRTVPRFGYRWVLPLDANGAPAEAESSTSVPPIDVVPAAPIPAKRWSGRRIGLAFLLVALVVGAWLLRTRMAVPPDASAASGTVLVLPVTRTGGDNETAWLRLGAMDYIASHLRDRAHLQVLPSEQTLLLIGKDTDPADAGALHRLELATSASYILAPYASLDHDDWKFLLDAYHGGGVQSFEAHAENPLDAATIVIDRFIASIGIDARASSASTPAATMQMKRLDAAMLAGDLDEAHRLVDTLPEAARKDPEVAVRVGQVAFRAGQLQAATAAFEPLVTDATPLSVRAQAHMGLGAVAVRQSDFAAADREYSAAVAALSTSGNAHEPDLLGTAYSGRGVANAARSQFDAALADFGRARVELERASDRTGTAMVDVNLGLVEADRGHYNDAAQAFDRAIAIFTRFGVRDHLAAALLGKSNAQLALLDHTGALADSARAQELAAHLENPLLKRRIAAVRASALLTNGELRAAQDTLDAIDPPTETATDPDFGILRARASLERGDVESAVRLATKAFERARATQAPPSFGDAVQLAVNTTRRGGALSLLEQALVLAHERGAHIDFDLARQLGEAQLLASREDAGAERALAAAFTQADQHGVPDAVVVAGIAYADYLLRHHELEPAATIVGRLAPYADRDYRAAHAVAALYLALGNTEAAASAQAQARRLAGERDPSLPM
jgi:DNA-binding winged helix-turn-helix (wHTH) protein/tetratricopeptide (TPR) repeat protein